MITLQLGMKAPEVWLLKVWLNGVVHRYSLPDLPLDLPFGPNTKAAVQQFQGSRGLPADGVVDPLTWRELAQAAKLVPVPAVDPAGRPTHMYWPLFLRDSKKSSVDRMRFRSAFAKTFGNAASQKATGLEMMADYNARDVVNTDKTKIAWSGAAFDVGTEIADYAKKLEVCLAYGMGKFLG